MLFENPGRPPPARPLNGLLWRVSKGAFGTVGTPREEEGLGVLGLSLILNPKT